jgi:mono/diheme cytochrome c family protein
LLVVSACTGKFIRPTDPNLKVESTPERIARGQYLVDSVGACGTCHSGRDGGDNFEAFLLSGESTSQYLAGGMYADLKDIMGAALWLPNITPDPETGIGNWTDDEIIRSIRDGINREGKLMFPMMPFNSYQHMSDEDVHSIVAYLRSVPPVKLSKPRKPVEVAGLGGFFLFGLGVAHHDPVVRPVAAPDRSDKVKYGEYVMRAGHCWECHSANADGSPRMPDDPLWMAGGRCDDFGPSIGKACMRNLTPDEETGLGKYSAEQIKQAIREGKRLDGKKMAPPMSMMIPHWSTMTDEDLDALVAYLKSLKPAKNKVEDRKFTPEFAQKLGLEN